MRNDKKSCFNNILQKFQPIFYLANSDLRSLPIVLMIL